MRIAVVGTGYVGLVSGAGFADFGHTVTCIDVDGERIARLQRGDVPFHEPGLPELVARGIASGRLRFTTEPAVADAAIVFLAVGTPALPEGAADLAQLRAAAIAVARGLGPAFTVIATKSTVPVGTSAMVHALIAEHTRQPFAVAANPELLAEGSAVRDFMRPSRVIIGSDDARAVAVLRELYRAVMRTSDRIHVMDARSAELAKYAANAMLATRISLMNELAELATAVGADIEHVREAVGADPRIGARYLFPGAGFGGSCLPKDLRALAAMAREANISAGIATEALAANARQTAAFAARIVGALAPAAGKRVAVWGVAFKPNTDDVREAPALAVIETLLAAGAAVTCSDPVALDSARAMLGDRVRYTTDPYLAAEGADATVLVTEWHALRQPDFARLAATMRTPLVFDGRNVWDPDEVRRAGMVYRGVGR